MNDIQKELKNEDGTMETLSINSTDNYDINISKNYVLANHNEIKENKFVKKFKNSLLGSDIGIKSGGFTSVAILATVIAVSTLLVMYFMWKY